MTNDGMNKHNLHTFEIAGALYVGQDQGVQIHRRIVSVKG